MSKKQIAVIGGGASGMMAAITAARNGAQVTIYEHTERLGKKILSTGNGKCNLSNSDMAGNCFFSNHMERVETCLQKFSVAETIDFFEGLGLSVKEKNGYYYPLAQQAAVVLDVLRIAVENLGIQVIYNAQVNEIYQVVNSCGNRVICIEHGKNKDFYHSVIIACGSKAAPKTGSDGSGYDLVKKLGHKLQPVLPALVQLKCNDSFCKAIAGIRAEADIHIYDDKRLLCNESGELQLTDYGISGIPVFQLSGTVNRYFYAQSKKKNKGKIDSNGKDAELIARINFLPDMEEKDFQKLVNARLDRVSEWSERMVEEFFTGFLNKKLMLLFIKLAGLQPGAKVSSVKKSQLSKVFEYCRQLEMHIIGSNSFDNAQVCTGGVDLQEVTDDLESIKVKGVYFAGEILDVDGRCGGYNLQWAWTSGYVAGMAASEGNRRKLCYE